MKTYTSIDKLRRDWYTTKELFKVLDDRNYPHNNQALMRWEAKGIIPLAKRVQIMGREWRVYAKDNSDFVAILESLDKAPKKIGR